MSLTSRISRKRTIYSDAGGRVTPPSSHSRTCATACPKMRRQIQPVVATPLSSEELQWESPNTTVDPEPELVTIGSGDFRLG